MIRRTTLLKFVAAFSLLLICSGCGLEPTYKVRALPSLPPESPPANLPSDLHQRNWTSKKRDSFGQGSCVHASFTSHVRWLNRHDIGERWRATYHGGEFDSRLRDRLDAANIDYVFTLKADPRFLDWCHETRRGCILWWKPSHCCTFMGWVDRNGQQYAAILDNNYPGRFELTPREQFVRLWAGYGGFALSALYEPATSNPYLSYEVIK
jgi:hypothetical protein